MTKPKTTAQKAKAYNNYLKAKIRIQVHKMIKKEYEKVNTELTLTKSLLNLLLQKRHELCFGKVV